MMLSSKAREGLAKKKNKSLLRLKKPANNKTTTIGGYADGCSTCLSWP